MAKRMYVVTYDIPATATAATRKAISDAVQSTGNWWHYLKPTWLVVSDKNAEAISGIVAPHVEKAEGRLLVVEVAPANRQGLLPKEGWDWIRTWTKRFQEGGG
jgi:hypothetical protein